MIIKKKELLIFFFLLILVPALVYAYTTYGAPAEFGSDVATTCFVGGDNGVLNCTGELIIDRINSTGDIWTNNKKVNHSILLDLTAVGGEVSGTIGTITLSNTALDDQYILKENISIVQAGNLSFVETISWANVTKSAWITPAYILDVDDEDIESDLNTYVDIAGDVVVGNVDWDDAVGESPKIRFLNQNDDVSQLYIQTTGDFRIEAANNLEITTGSGVISFDGTSVYSIFAQNCSAANSCAQIVYGNNGSVFVPSHETDAAHDVCSEITNCVDNAWDADGDISADELSESKINFVTACAAGNHYYLSGNDLACEADDDTTCGTSGICSTVYQSAATLDSLYVSRGTWTDHDNYAAGCSANNFVSTIGDTLTCSIPQVSADTTPQLGGYLDANGQNIGSTTDEIENVYIGLNNKIFLGNGQEGEIYFDGTKLIIKVN